ncbi:hypothetical protein MRX96_019016 [Rhipicephalus microplus]
MQPRSGELRKQQKSRQVGAECMRSSDIAHGKTPKAADRLVPSSRRACQSLSRHPLRQTRSERPCGEDRRRHSFAATWKSTLQYRTATRR